MAEPWANVAQEGELTLARPRQCPSNMGGHRMEKLNLGSVLPSNGRCGTCNKLFPASKGTPFAYVCQYCKQCVFCCQFPLDGHAAKAQKPMFGGGGATAAPSGVFGGGGVVGGGGTTAAPSGGLKFGFGGYPLPTPAPPPPPVPLRPAHGVEDLHINDEATAQMRRLFTLLDKTGDGLLTSDDFPGTEHSKWQLLKASFDLNGDNKITPEEFMLRFKKSALDSPLDPACFARVPKNHAECLAWLTESANRRIEDLCKELYESVGDAKRQRTA